MDVLVPAIKKAVYDIVTNGIDMFLYGGSGRGKSSSNGPKVSYSRYYESKSSNMPSYRANENRNSNGLNYEEIVFSTRGEAEAALQQLRDIVAKYGMARVNDLYEMADLSAPYTTQKYGWMDVSSAYVDRVRDGYILKLPRAVPID